MNLDRLKELAIYCEDNLALEWVMQGHNLTSAAAASMTHSIEETGAGVIISIMTDKEYMFIQNQGVRPDRIPYKQGSGAQSSKYISALISYFIARGLPEGEAKRAAFATANKHKQEGMQTKASARYSKTGRRKGFVEDMIERTEGHIEREATQWAFDEFSDRINKALKTA